MSPSLFLQYRDSLLFNHLFSAAQQGYNKCVCKNKKRCSGGRGSFSRAIPTTVQHLILKCQVFLNVKLLSRENSLESSCFGDSELGRCFHGGSYTQMWWPLGHGQRTLLSHGECAAFRLIQDVTISPREVSLRGFSWLMVTQVCQNHEPLQHYVVTCY